MRLLSLIALLALGGAGYVYWTQQNALTPMAQAAEPLSRYEKLARCAALHGALDDAMDTQGKSMLERLANKAFEEVFLFAAKSDQTRGDRNETAVTGEITALKAKYATASTAHVKGDRTELITRDIAHCSDLKAVLG